MTEKTTIQVTVDLKNDLDYLKTKDNPTYETVIRELLPDGVSETDSFTKEEPAFILKSTDNDHHTPDLEVGVSWSELKNSKPGDCWESELRNNTETATVLYVDDDGCFIRFIEHYHPVHGDDDYKEVFLRYFHFL